MPSLAAYTGGSIGTRLAAHLLRRASYAYTKPAILSFANKTADQAVDSLFVSNPPSIPEPVDYQTGNYWINMGISPVSSSYHLNRYIKGWWLDEACQSLSIEYKMMFFLHTTFTVSVFDEASEDFWDYLSLLKYCSKGSFKEFALKITQNNLMSEYLDNNVNFGFNPNENYAREFLELFTIGKGPQVGIGDYTTFTELDVQEATKVMSGWRPGDRSNPSHADPNTGINANIPVYGFHNTSDKTFSHRLQNTTILSAVDENDMNRELKDFVDLIFSQMETARNLARKIYRFFVCPSISASVHLDIIEPLATLLYNNDYDLELAVKTLLKSEHFFDMDTSSHGDDIIGGMIKPPLELVAQTISFFKITRPDPMTESFWHYLQFYHRAVLTDTFENAAFNLFSPESVAGYSAYHQNPTYDYNWFHSGSIISRYKMGQMFISGFRWTANELIGTNLDIPDFVKSSGYFSNPADASTLVDEMLEYLFPFVPDTNRKNYFLNDIFLVNLNAMNWLIEWQNYVNTGNDSDVKIPLNNLLRSILYAQEYHAF